MASDSRHYKHNRLQQLRGFYYTACTGSISKAAERMFLSQPSVSLQIKALERELGVQLFERHGPRISLTPDGKSLLEIAQPLIEGFDNLDEEFAAQRESVEGGTVRLAAGGSTLQFILPTYVEKFVDEYPSIDLRLFNVTGKAGLKLLRHGDVDFAVGPMVETPRDIVFYPLMTYEPVLIARVDHPLARRRRIGLRDVAKYPLILPPKDQTTYHVVESAFAERSLPYEVKLEVGGYEVIKRYVTLGLGISIVMSHCLTRHDKLFTFPLGRYFPKRRYGIVLRKGKQLTPAAKCFVRTMQPELDVDELAESQRKAR